jgi:hypothetical protein
MTPIWIGYIVAGLAILGFIVAFVVQRRKKATDTRSHHTVLLDGFPIVHIPISLSREEAERISKKLRYTYVKTWAQMIKIYGEDVGEMPIATIGSSLFEIDPEHRHIKWPMPRDKVFLRVQPSMYYWFAGELHNMFRYLLHGTQWVYNTKDSTDKKFANKAYRWIDRMKVIGE